MQPLFNFDQLVDRHNTRSVKWDENDDPEVLPLWVADMDLATAPCVQDAIVKRALHPCYGYTLVPEDYYEAIRGWFWRRHSWSIGREEILYTIGVIPAIAAILKAVTQAGDNVVIMTPVYNCFYNLIRNAGCQAAEVPLEVKTSDQNQMTYSIDWEGLEQALAQEKTTVVLLCNPHNPVGRLWSAEELRRVAELSLKHGVMVISDEIHCELTRPGTGYVPFGTCLDETLSARLRYAVCTSPSKAFNIAGLQNANIIVPDAELRRRIDRAINLNETCDVNPFGVEAVVAAYNEGAPWLEALCQYIWSNYAFARAYLNKELPALRVAELQATYLMWVDYRALLPQIPSTELADRLTREAKVWFAAGSAYGRAGEGHLRINLATNRQTLAEALRRLTEWLRTNC